MNPISRTTQSLWEPSPVGAGLARDAGDAVHQTNRGDAFAGKPAPTKARAHIRPVALLALAVSLAGCAGLPDQRLANEALKRGDTATAAQNYQQLADLGYSEAQVGLADIRSAAATRRRSSRPKPPIARQRMYRHAPRLAWAACWWPSPAPPRPNTMKPKAC